VSAPSACHQYPFYKHWRLGIKPLQGATLHESLQDAMAASSQLCFLKLERKYPKYQVMLLCGWHALCVHLRYAVFCHVQFRFMGLQN
jgi:hypothetical protein